MRSWVCCEYVLRLIVPTVNSRRLQGKFESHRHSLFATLSRNGRLSLAHDSDKLLERYICTLPKHAGQPWYDMKDAYDSSLWDIDPICQVAAICDNDTVVLDGARGATIEWSGFDCIWHKTGYSWRRLISSAVVTLSLSSLALGVGTIFFFGIFLQLPIAAAQSAADEQVMLGLGYLLFWLITAPFNPFLVRITLTGKIQDIQGAFYGVEGYLNPATVERLIFGGNFGRFKWSTNGSLLSLSRVNEHKEKVGIDPSVDVDTRKKIEAAKVARPGDMRASDNLLLRRI